MNNNELLNYGTLNNKTGTDYSVGIKERTYKFTYPIAFIEKLLPTEGDNIRIIKSTGKPAYKLQLEMLTRTQKLIAVYHEARIYLKSILPNEVKDDLQRYFTPIKCRSLKEITQVVIDLFQAKRTAIIIGFCGVGRKELFGRLLLDYDCKAISKEYTSETLFQTFVDNLGVLNAECKMKWQKYAKSILSFCKYMDKFEDAEDFDRFICSFKGHEIDLPNQLEQEIVGFSFELSCKFLKAIGKGDYPNPDVHLKAIFVVFELCENKARSVFKAVIEMANLVEDTSYNIDRLFWLIGSGDFFEHKIRIGSHRNEFIKTMRAKGF